MKGIHCFVFITFLFEMSLLISFDILLLFLFNSGWHCFVFIALNSMLSSNNPYYKNSGSLVHK